MRLVKEIPRIHYFPLLAWHFLLSRVSFLSAVYFLWIFVKYIPRHLLKEAVLYRYALQRWPNTVGGVSCRARNCSFCWQYLWVCNSSFVLSLFHECLKHNFNWLIFLILQSQSIEECLSLRDVTPFVSQKSIPHIAVGIKKQTLSCFPEDEEKVY